jgi:hypothetical protein
MINPFRILAVAAAVLALLVPEQGDAKSAKPHAKITVHPKQRWHGYGFLPGYRPSLAESQGIPVLGPDPRPKHEIRYYDIYGNVRYGYGQPGFYRGRWNGGSIGPCWTQTPIGPMWNCGP